MTYDLIKKQLQEIGVLSNAKLVPRYKSMLVNNTNVVTQIVNCTDFLTDTSSQLSERLFCILHGITSQPRCPCGAFVKFKYNKYATYCSRGCSNSNQIKIDNTKRSTPKQLEHKKQQYTKTCLRKYGVPHSSKLQENRKLAAITCYDRHGVKNPLSLPDNQKKAHAAIKKKFGNNSFKQSLIIPKSLMLLNDPKWLIEQHKIKTLKKIATELSVSDVTVGNYFKKYDISVNSFQYSMGETEIYEFLKQYVTVIRNTKRIIPPYEIDLFIPTLNLAIEYCGLYWHSEQKGKHRNYHKHKMDLCATKGIQLITLFEDEWVNKPDIVKSMLLAKLKLNQTRIFARNTTIANVPHNIKKSFLNQFHIQGNGAGSINLGLYYNNQLVACITFIKHKNQKYTLNRYCTSINVIGGFSKLVKHFQRTHHWDQIISFADCRISQGNLYHHTNWELDKILPPDYYYSIDGLTKYHKFNFRRNKLKSRLHSFNPLLSEKKNCDNNGILRIWDCGKLKFLINNQQEII